MAGFETIVRPTVFPDIRPAPAQPVPPQDDPKQGFCTITGSSGKTLDLPYSYNMSSDQSRPVEMKRRVDQVRVYQKDDDGKVNKDNFVDINVATKMWMSDAGASISGAIEQSRQAFKTYFYGPPPDQGEPGSENDNIEVRRRGLIIKNPKYYGSGLGTVETPPGAKADEPK
jgi:hypothetical protein